LIACGLGVFRISPRDFWSLSLREWRALIDARAQRAAALSRGEFAKLAARYPD
jgi:uncharacterized phage protein (TIGR02216 family)